MKKYTMWIILVAVLLVELIVYFILVSPQGAVIEENRKKAERVLKSLENFEKMGSKIPTTNANKVLEENRKKLEAQYGKIIEFYKNDDTKGLKKWFQALNIRWENTPTPAQFQSLYLDEFKKLENLCKEKWITLGAGEETVMIELESGEKVSGAVLRDEGDALVMQAEGSERELSKDKIVRMGKVTEKLSSEANALSQTLRRAAKSFDPTDTVPNQTARGFWITNQLNQENLRTAQMQFNIQKAIVNALVDSGADKLSYVSFHESNQPNAPQEGVIEEHFDKTPVSFIARMSYGAIALMLEKLNSPDPYINMKFVNIKVLKPKLNEIATKHVPGATGVKIPGQLTNFVFPRVIDKDGGVRFGKQPIGKMAALPGQAQLLEEPPVVVLFSYEVMSVKEKLPEIPE